MSILVLRGLSTRVACSRLPQKVSLLVFAPLISFSTLGQGVDAAEHGARLHEGASGADRHSG